MVHLVGFYYTNKEEMSGLGGPIFYVPPHKWISLPHIYPLLLLPLQY